MEPVQTLHDFTTNLLSDPTAMTAFENNPEAVLKDAGFGDLTPQDVLDVMPLVVDYASAPDLDSATDLGSSLDLVDQLDAAGLSDADTQLGNVVATTTALAEDLTGDVGLGGDLGQHLDTDALDSVTSGVGTEGNAVQGVTGTVSDVVGGDLGAADLGGTTLPVDVVGDVTGAATHTGDLGVTDTVDATLHDTVGDVAGNLSDNPVTTALSDVASDSGNLTGNLSSIHDVVGDVGLNGDATGIGSVTDVVDGLGDINVGGIGNGNDVDF